MTLREKYAEYNKTHGRVTWGQEYARPIAVTIDGLPARLLQPVDIEGRSPGMYVVDHEGTFLFVPTSAEIITQDGSFLPNRFEVEQAGLNATRDRSLR
jgi:hypothetical protein